MSKWQPNETLPREKRCIIIRHNRGTWMFPEDPDKINCVVVYYAGQTQSNQDLSVKVDCWKAFDLTGFTRDQIEQWCEIPERDL